MVEKKKGTPPQRNKGLADIVAPLLAWYDQEARILPWRSNPIPYHVWVSEIMLQQTRVEAVIPYFERFLREIPSIPALAETDEQVLLKLWEGLGYYNRVKNLKKAAIMLVEEYGGELPADEATLKKLPGIGDYTAGAIASIAFGLNGVAVDGNVLRVITRLLADDTDIQNVAFKKTVAGWLREITPAGRTGDFTQAMMELGATVCLPNGEPLCAECPLALQCAVYAQGTWLQFPQKTPKKSRRIEKKTMLILLSNDQHLALQKRVDSGLLASLWELPSFPEFLTKGELCGQLEEVGIAHQSITKLGRRKHIFTHIEWQMQYYLVEGVSLTTTAERPLFFVSKQELMTTYPLPKAFHSYYDEILSVLQ